MRKLLVPMIGAALVLAGYAAAQTTQSSAPTGTTMEKTETKKVKDPNGPDTKTKKTTVIGSVKEYEAGKKIKIATSKSKSKSFDLDAKDTTATVDPAVAVGSRVQVVDAKDDAGNHVITVSIYKAKSTKHKS